MGDCGELLIGQLEFYWDYHLRPRLDGLTDDEYQWAPVQPSWTVHAYAEDSMLALISHLNRETMHHGAEICLLRDLYRAGLATK